MENFHDLVEVQTGIGGWHIRAKVIRIFTPLSPTNSSLGLILTDAKGVKIECSISSQFVEHYVKLLKDQDWISILIFHVGENTRDIRATNHSCKIHFYDITMVKKVDPPMLEPCNTFAPFSSIFDETVNTSILLGKCFILDVTSHIVKVSRISDILFDVMYDVGELKLKGSYATNIDNLRIKFFLRGICTSVLKCKAYGRTAKEIHDNYLPYNEKALVVILQMWKVNRWFSGAKNVRIENHGRISKIIPEPDVPETDDVHSVLCWCNDEECWAH